MNIKINRFLLLIVACSATGVVMGGSLSWLDSHLCLIANTPTTECLTQDPAIKTIQGMGSGLLAGAGAALGASLTLKQQQKKQED